MEATKAGKEVQVVPVGKWGQWGVMWGRNLKLIFLECMADTEGFTIIYFPQ